MRNEAIAIFELTKGFTREPMDAAMKSCLEMAGYVMELTNDVDEDIKEEELKNKIELW